MRSLIGVSFRKKVKIDTPEKVVSGVGADGDRGLLAIYT
jgi:hypothetical protein